MQPTITMPAVFLCTYKKVVYVWPFRGKELAFIFPVTYSLHFSADRKLNEVDSICFHSIATAGLGARSQIETYCHEYAKRSYLSSLLYAISLFFAPLELELGIYVPCGA